MTKPLILEWRPDLPKPHNNTCMCLYCIRARTELRTYAEKRSKQWAHKARWRLLAGRQPRVHNSGGNL